MGSHPVVLFRRVEANEENPSAGLVDKFRDLFILRRRERAEWGGEGVGYPDSREARSDYRLEPCEDGLRSAVKTDWMSFSIAI